MNGRIKLLALFVLCAALCMMMLPMSAFAADTDTTITIDGANMTADALKTAVTDALNAGKRDFTITGNLNEEQQKAAGTALRDWCGEEDNVGVYNPGGQGTVSLTLSDVTEVYGDTFGKINNVLGYALKSVHLPQATIIGENAFCDQKYLTTVVAPKVTEVKGRSFYSADALTDVQMPNITTVGQSAFAWTGITTFPWDNLQSIGGAAFSLTGISGVISLPKATTIDIDAFMRCSNLTGVIAPSVTTVSGSAFAYCPNLTELTFGTAITSWGGQVLHNGNNPLYSENITLTLAADQKVLSGGDNTDYWSSWTVAAGAETVEFGENKTFCGYTFKKIIGHNHNFSTEWSKDTDGHWHECSCGAKSDEAVHTGGTATCKDKAVCTACGQPYGSLNSSNHTDDTEIRDQKAATEFEAGYTGDTYCLGCNTITKKGEEILATHQHFYLLKRDATGHWEECSCGATRYRAAHIPGVPATETAPQTCTVCSYELSPVVIPTPTPKPTAKPTATPEPTATPIPDTSDLPKTGDASRPGLWMMLLLAAGACAAALRRARTN